MDLNHFYFQHQLSVIRAYAAKSAGRKAFHQKTADALGRQIQKYQSGAGASASKTWSGLRFGDPLNLIAAS